MTRRTINETKPRPTVADDDEREAFVAFYHRSGEQVLRALTLTLGDSELGRDATQEAMARAWRRWREVSGYANPAGWAYRVGLNWARSRTRRLSREVVGRLHDRSAPAPEPPDPELARALRGLAAGQRAVVVLRLYLDWSVEDVATALGIPEGTVKSRLHTAMRRLRRDLEEEQ